MHASPTTPRTLQIFVYIYKSEGERRGEGERELAAAGVPINSTAFAGKEPLAPPYIVACGGRVVVVVDDDLQSGRTAAPCGRHRNIPSIGG